MRIAEGILFMPRVVDRLFVPKETGRGLAGHDSEASEAASTMANLRDGGLGRQALHGQHLLLRGGRTCGCGD